MTATTPVKLGLMAEKNSVFVAFYTPPTHLYQTNDDCRAWGHEAWFSKVALLGVMVRWDGEMGFVGGQVDQGETLIQAAIRECSEEVNYSPLPGQLTLVCSHHMKSKRRNFEQHTHLYACEVSPEIIYEIRKNSVSSEHARVESAGFSVVHMTNTAPQKLLNNGWAGTGAEELKLLLERKIIAEHTIEVNNNPLVV